MTDPLDKFIVDENEPLDKTLVAEIIEPFVESIGKNGVLKYTKQFHNAPAWLKTAVYLCCRKVMLDKGIITKEEVGPKEISVGAIIGESAAKKIAIDENLQSLVSKKGAGYIIPNYNLQKTKKMIQKVSQTK